MSNELISNNYKERYYKEEVVMLDKIVFMARDFLGPDEIKDNLFLELVASNLYHKIEARLSIYIKGEKLKDEIAVITFRYPKNWWEHFKKAKFPKRLLEKYPVQYEERSKKTTFKVGEFIPTLSKYLKVPPNERLYFQSLEYDNYSSLINMEEEH